MNSVPLRNQAYDQRDKPKNELWDRATMEGIGDTTMSVLYIYKGGIEPEIVQLGWRQESDITLIKILLLKSSERGWVDSIWKLVAGSPREDYISVEVMLKYNEQQQSDRDELEKIAVAILAAPISIIYSLEDKEIVKKALHYVRQKKCRGPLSTIQRIILNSGDYPVIISHAGKKFSELVLYSDGWINPGVLVNKLINPTKVPLGLKKIFYPTTKDQFGKPEKLMDIQLSDIEDYFSAVV